MDATVQGVNYLRKVGVVYRTAKTGELIVSLREGERPPRLGSKVFDNAGRPVGVVRDVMGPVEAPYLIVKPLEEKGLPPGTEVFIETRLYKGGGYGRRRGRRSRRRR